MIHPDGLWEFNNSLSLAFEDLQKANAEIEGGEQLTFIDRDAELASTIRENVAAIVAQGESFRPGDRMKDVFGDVGGQAREKHLRRALRELEAEGAIPSGSSKGPLQKKLITPPP